jgi:hypothetical protein
MLTSTEGFIYDMYYNTIMRIHGFDINFETGTSGILTSTKRFTYDIY